MLGLKISCFYDAWKYDHSDYTKIIIEDATLDNHIFDYLRRLHPNAQLVFWFRNSLNAVDYVRSKEIHIKHAAMCDRTLSFDKNDSEVFGYEYIENPYGIDNSLRLQDEKYDMIFMGADKSRFNSIMNLVKYTEKLGWNNFIYIYSKTKVEDEYVKNKFMPYKDYLVKMSQSRAILDIVDSSYQKGYSLRIFESLFYKKKLITNHIIIKNEPFYNPNNIYVIDSENEDAYSGLDNFINLPYEEVAPQIMRRYNFYDWIKRI